jgi:hypothetical protein
MAKLTLGVFHLIHLCLTSFNVSPTARHFPEVEVFNLVAPYYLIPFIPPPNDPHEITREDLCVALNRILLYPPLSKKIYRTRLRICLALPFHCF